MDKNINMKSSKGGKGKKEEKKGGDDIEANNTGVSKYYPEFLKKAAHPGVCLWHIFFKSLAILSYFFLGIFVSNKALSFIIIIILSAFDFWVVKNITGRILVGLRWWSQVKEDGTEEWYFESLDEKKNSGMDSFMFWLALYVTPIVWGVFAVSSILSFNFYNFSLCLAACILSGTNLYGYIK